MPEQPNGPGLGWLLAAKVVCCGGLVLAATGALSLGSLAGWFLDGGIVWLAIAGLVCASLYLWRRRRKAGGSRDRKAGIRARLGTNRRERTP